MTTTPTVRCTILGEAVEGTLVDAEPTADYASGLGLELVVDVDGAHWRVDEADAEIAPR